MAILIRPVTLGQPKIKALVYGAPGVGKTVLAATAAEHPQMAKVLYANIDGGLISIASRKGLLEAPINCIEELEELQGMAARGAEEFTGVNTLVIDSGTELLENLLRQIALREFKKDKQRDRDKNQIEDYGETTAKLTRIFRWCRDLPLHVIMTAHEKVDRKLVDTRKQSKHDAPVLSVRPKFTDKLGTSIMGCFDYVWYMYMNNDGLRCLMTQPNSVVQAKTRGERFAPALGNVVKDPNMSEIYSLLIKTEGQSND